MKFFKFIFLIFFVFIFPACENLSSTNENFFSPETTTTQEAVTPIINNKNISCRIGMTMNLERRKKEWERRYLKEGKVIKNWVVLSTHKSKSSAQEVETTEAKKQNCEAHPGGRGSENAIWHVYKIEYEFFR